jgi:hypothetical protein
MRIAVLLIALLAGLSAAMCTSQASAAGRGYFKVSRTGSTTVSATHPSGHGGKSRQVIQSVYGCRWFPSVSAHWA